MRPARGGVLSAPTTLYRFFDERDQLLYVGIAGNPGRRFDQHAKGPDGKPWWPRVVRSTMEHFDTREAALAAEAAVRRIGEAAASKPGGTDERVGADAERHTDSQRSTIGWTECECPDDGTKWRPGVVLDPFAGSGTTLMVATGQGRDTIGIDIDHRNADLALDRVGPLLLTVEHLTDEAAS